LLRLTCPVCGLRDETEFTYGGDASARPPDLDDPDQAAWHDFIFLRDNPAGMHFEYWHHALGCRHWLLVERDTLTHEFGRITLARDRTGRHGE
jgi:sarcosine oxidase subunit delta